MFSVRNRAREPSTSCMRCGDFNHSVNTPSPQLAGFFLNETEMWQRAGFAKRLKQMGLEQPSQFKVVPLLRTLV